MKYLYMKSSLSEIVSDFNTLLEMYVSYTFLLEMYYHTLNLTIIISIYL